MNKEICLVIPSLHSGGIESEALRYLEYIDSRKNITVVVRKDIRKGEFLERFEQSGVNLVFMSMGYLNPFKFFKYYKFFKNSNFYTVCDFSANFSALTILASYLARVKNRITSYKQGEDLFEKSFIKSLINALFNKIVYRFSTKIIANSHAAIEYFFPYRNNNDIRFEVIYNGIDYNQFRIHDTKEQIRKYLNLPQDKFIVGHIGRLTKAKNHDVILKVCKNLSERDEDVHFVLGGRNIESLEAKIKEMSIDENMTLLGYQDNIPRVFKSFDMFFFPSLTEGQPNALLEAMLLGLPIVASNIEPIKECVPQTEYNFLCNPKDSECFAEKILEVKSDCRFRSDLKNFAQKSFSAEKNIKHFHNLLID